MLRRELGADHGDQVGDPVDRSEVAALERDLQALLERQHDIDDIEAVGAELDERRSRAHLVQLEAEALVDDVANFDEQRIAGVGGHLVCQCHSVDQLITTHAF